MTFLGPVQSRLSSIAKPGVILLVVCDLALTRLHAVPPPQPVSDRPIAARPDAIAALAFAPPADPQNPESPEALAEAARAFALNEAIPAVAGAALPAAPFSLGAAASPTDRMSATDCLTIAVYYEAASESLEGQRAVAQVVLNRMRHPIYPHSVCGVVFQGSERTTGCQFTFTCDGSLARVPAPVLWRKARAVAEAALSGYVEKSVGTATHYHTQWVAPVWRLELAKITTLGAHIFYRWQGNWGRPAAFTARYFGNETGIGAGAALANTKLAALVAPSDALAAFKQGYDADEASPLPRSIPMTTVPPTALRADAGRAKLLADERKGLLVDTPAGVPVPRLALKLSPEKITR